MKEKKNQSNIGFSADELNLMTLAKQYSDEDKARALFEKLRWPNGPVCPHCKNDGKAKAIYDLKPKPGSKSPARAGVYKCGACRQQFTAKVGTVLEASHIPIATWLMALFIYCSSKKSVSALQLSRMLNVTYKTGWFLAHRIRYGIQPETAKMPKLTGTVEVDETFVGGKGDAKTKIVRKTPVVALIERGGDMRTQVVSNVTQKNLKAVISETVDTKAVINTDDSGAYRDQLKAYAGHETVNHSAKEYVVKNADGSVSHINTCESFFSLLKRGVIGSWHHVSMGKGNARTVRRRRNQTGIPAKAPVSMACAGAKEDDHEQPSHHSTGFRVFGIFRGQKSLIHRQPNQGKSRYFYVLQFRRILLFQKYLCRKGTQRSHRKHLALFFFCDPCVLSWQSTRPNQPHSR